MIFNSQLIDSSLSLLPQVHTLGQGHMKVNVTKLNLNVQLLSDKYVWHEQI